MTSNQIKFSIEKKVCYYLILDKEQLERCYFTNRSKNLNKNNKNVSIR
jgi:hypothetical protein